MPRTEEDEKYQIVRIDAKNCFVESLNDWFSKRRIHFRFMSYDANKAPGQRATGTINIYIDIGDFANLIRRLNIRELIVEANNNRKAQSNSPLFQTLGGTSAEKLAKLGNPRQDGKSLSRTMQITAGRKNDFFLVAAASGPGEVNNTGLIVPKFGNRPECQIAVGMDSAGLSKLLLLTDAHWRAWLTAYYMRNPV